jgi:hypothetical protein
MADTVERVGLDVDDGEEVRCFGLRATGGGAFFDVELVVDVDKRRSGTSGCDCPAAGLKVEVLFSKAVWEKPLAKEDTAEIGGLKAGGNFLVLVPLVTFEEDPRGFGGGGATGFVARDSGRGTWTQSGSSVGV